MSGIDLCMVGLVMADRQFFRSPEKYTLKWYSINENMR